MEEKSSPMAGQFLQGTGESRPFTVHSWSLGVCLLLGNKYPYSHYGHQNIGYVALASSVSPALLE